MKKAILLLIALTILVGSATAQTANETQQILQQAENDIEIMEEEGIPTERVENLLESANNSYLAQRNFAQEGGTADYSRAVELAQQISDIQERAIRVSDRISALEMRLNELEGTSVNLTQAQTELEAAKEDFQSQRFEQAGQHVESGYSEISEAQSARTQIESFAAAQREDISGQINSVIDYIRENTEKVAGGTVIGLLMLFFVTKEFHTYRLIKRRKRKVIKENVLERLITDIQEEYYMRKKGSPIQFNTKMEKFEDMRRNVVEDVEVIDSKLENRRSLLFRPDKHQEQDLEINQPVEETTKSDDAPEDKKQQKPVKVTDPAKEGQENISEKESHQEDNKEEKEAEKASVPDEENKEENSEEQEESEVEQSDGLVCEECGEEFGTERGLSIHKERMHDSEVQVKGVVCPECGDIFDTERGMHIHKGEVHDN